MPIELIIPTASNFIKDWPAQNAINCDRIDDYAGPCTIVHGLTAYQPRLTTPFVNPSIGTGGSAVNRGYYYRIFDQIYVWGEFRFGSSGMNVGGGVYYISLPFQVKSNLPITNTTGLTPVVGTATAFTNAVGNRQSLTVHLATPTDVMFSVRINSGMVNREVAHNVPVAWVPGEGISWNAKFQRV